MTDCMESRRSLYLPYGVTSLDAMRAWVGENYPGYRITEHMLCIGPEGERQCVTIAKGGGYE